jgi:uncharacterized repeat protein (TIGR01451 family)
VLIRKISADIATTDIAISAEVTPNPVTVGGNLTYTLTVRNRGPSSATFVSVSDLLPDSLMVVSAVASQGTCTGGYRNEMITCHLANLSNGAHATVTIVAKPTVAGDLPYIATAGAYESDSNRGNNTAMGTVIARPIVHD